MKILIRKEQKGRITVKTVRNLAREILKSLKYDDAELSIVLTDDRGIQKLNKKYLQKDKPTDVLSFPMIGNGRRRPRDKKRFFQRPPLHSLLLGDVVLSVETAEVQAKKNGVTLEEEISRLLAHGILHLLNFDHERGRRDEVWMKEEEERLIDKVRKRGLLRT